MALTEAELEGMRAAVEATFDTVVGLVSADETPNQYGAVIPGSGETVPVAARVHRPSFARPLEAGRPLNEDTWEIHLPYGTYLAGLTAIEYSGRTLYPLSVNADASFPVEVIVIAASSDLRG